MFKIMLARMILLVIFAASLNVQADAFKEAQENTNYGGQSAQTNNNGVVGSLPSAAYSNGADDYRERSIDEVSAPDDARIFATPINSLSPSQVAAGASQVEGSDKNDLAGVGLDEVFAILRRDIEELDASMARMKANPNVTVKTIYPEFKTAFEAYASNRTACIDRQKYAAFMCLDHLSPAIKTTVSVINMGLSTIGTMAMKDSCSKFAKAMNYAKKGMSIYTAGCGAMRVGCGSACVSARKGLERMQALLPKAKIMICTPTVPGNGVALGFCGEEEEIYSGFMNRIAGEMGKELAPSDKRSINAKAALCEGKYAQLVASSVLGVMSMMASHKQAKECGNKSDGGGQQQTQAQTTAEKCAKADNATLQECICFKSPRTAGCPGAYNTNSASGSQFGLSSPTPSKPTSGGGPSNLDKNEFNVSAKKPEGSDSGASMPGPGGGGGAGLGGGGGGGSGAAGAGGEAGQKGLNANILGGFGGGEGGGGGGYSRFSASDANSPYKHYLPGGAKDPNLNLSGQEAWSKEVTSQGGKSNFEKVKDRYRDNTGRFLSN